MNNRKETELSMGPMRFLLLLAFAAATLLCSAGPIPAQEPEAVRGSELTRDLFSYPRLDDTWQVKFKVNVETEGLTPAAAEDDPALAYYLGKYPVTAEDSYGLFQDPGPYLLVTGLQKEGRQVTIRLGATPIGEFDLPDSGHQDIATRYRVTNLSYGFRRVMMTGETEADPDALVGLRKEESNGTISWTPSPVTRKTHSYTAAPVIMDLIVSYRVEEEMFKVADNSSYAPPQSNVLTMRVARLVLPICGNELEGRRLICPDETETWRSLKRGDLGLAIPKNWLEEGSAPPDQGAWHIGDRGNPDIGLLLIREESVDEVKEMMTVDNTEEITLGGRKATAYSGIHKGNNSRAKLIVFAQKGADGKLIILAATGVKWDEYRETMDLILQSITFDGEAKLPEASGSPPRPAAAATASPAPTASPSPAAATPGALSPQEQEELAASLFKQMIDTPDDQLATFEKLYREVIEKCPQSSKAEESYWRLSNLYILGFDPPRQKDAQLLLEDFLQKFPGSEMMADIHHRLVVIYEETEQWCKAADLYGAMETEGTGYPDYQAVSVNLLHGEALEKCGRTDEARARYEKVLELAGGDDSLEARAARENLAKLGPAATGAAGQTAAPATPTKQAGPGEGGERLAEIEQRLGEINQATEALKVRYAEADDTTKKELLAEFTRLKKEKSALLQEKTTTESK